MDELIVTVVSTTEAPMTKVLRFEYESYGELVAAIGLLNESAHINAEELQAKGN